MTAQTIANSETFSTHPGQKTISRTQLWIGRVLSWLAAAFFLMDAGMKLVKPPFVVQATVQLGYPESCIIGLGVALLLSTLLYLIPRTAIFGAVLLTGYLGGAVAANVRISSGWFNMLFPVVFASIAWTGLYLRDWRLKTFLAR
ncbi:DoxX family protein [Terriglobus albidus]|uniref:DoxX family protein n=1 Tax=Terriglobus albidus TaxID=1592106 RepID=A0A5B9E514_9BACT|nr:DoxX family protein [Terriglobus albidus]QEE27078.1 DoxX family protein [Terriglobus albidus]